MMMPLSLNVFLASPVATTSAASLSQPRPLSALDLETVFKSVDEAFGVDLWLKRVAIEVFRKVCQFWPVSVGCWCWCKC
jgi:hypothetical protein